MVFVGKQYKFLPIIRKILFPLIDFIKKRPVLRDFTQRIVDKEWQRQGCWQLGMTI